MNNSQYMMCFYYFSRENGVTGESLKMYVNVEENIAILRK